MAKSLETRLHEKLMPIPESGCHLFLGATESFGYGKINVNGRNERAHRAAWMLAYGLIPDGLCVLHKCDVPSCCNPNHLFLGTRTDNNIDAAKKGRTLRKLTFTDMKTIFCSPDSRSVLGKRYNVSRSMIGLIKHGKSGRYA